MKKFVGAAAVALLIFAAEVPAARADDVTFQMVDATFVDVNSRTIPEGTVTGTVVIDPVAGTWVSADLTYVNGGTTVVFDTPAADQGVFEGFTNADFLSGGYDIAIGVPTGSLVGYAGGPVCASDGSCINGPNTVVGNLSLNGDFIAIFATGSLTATPEPSALMLLGTAAIGFAGVARRRIIGR